MMTRALLTASLTLALTSVQAQPPLPGYVGAKTAAVPRVSRARARRSLPGYVEARPAAPAPIVGADEDLRDSVAAGTTGLRAGLRSQTASERLTAVLAAARPHDKEAIPYLAGVLLRADEDPQVRAAAALAIARIGEPSAATFLSFALSDRSPQVRQIAALALARLPAGATTRRLIKALRSDGRWQVRYAAAIALGRAAPASAAKALAKASLSDPDQRVRLQAARSLQTLNAARGEVVAQD